MNKLFSRVLFFSIILLFFSTNNNTIAQWSTNGNDVFWNNSGNVGIGLGTPIHKLHVNGDLGITNMSKLTFDNYFFLQFPFYSGNNWNRGIIGANLFWDNSAGVWQSPSTYAHDMAAILFNNNGSISFTNNNGFTPPTSFTTAQVEGFTKMYISPSGNVGIGTGISNPEYKLHIKGDIGITNMNKLSLDNYFFIQFPFYSGTNWNRGIIGANLFWDNTSSVWRSPSTYAQDMGAILFTNGGGISFVNTNGFTPPTSFTDSQVEGFTKMYISPSGNIGIGTKNPGNFKLAVKGNIRAEEIIVETGWSDFVFENNYKLMPLNELESFVKENKHLPEIPSEAEVKQNGVSLGETQSKLLQKIEELTLYVIEQNKQIKELQKENQRINKLLNSK